MEIVAGIYDLKPILSVFITLLIGLFASNTESLKLYISSTSTP